MFDPARLDVLYFWQQLFAAQGLTLFTLRNGSPNGTPYEKCYAEKIMHGRDGQLTPMHPSSSAQMGGTSSTAAVGNLTIELWNAGAHAETENTDVTVNRRVAVQTDAPWQPAAPTRGEHLSDHGLYHSFWGRTRILATCWWAEVSSVNDDERQPLLQPVARYNNIEDEPAVRAVQRVQPVFPV